MSQWKHRIYTMICLIPLAAAACGTSPRLNAATDGVRADELDWVPASEAGLTMEALAQAAVQDTIRAVLDEWSVQLSQATIPAGQATFIITNRGQYTHAFKIDDEDDDDDDDDREWRVGPIPPGESRVLTATIPAGRYEVYCPIEDEHGDHEDMGMRTILTVR